MFTGIIQHLGKVAKLEPTQMGLKLVIDTNGWDHNPQLGESIAVSGCCLTVAEFNTISLLFDVIQQTLNMTTLGELIVGSQVNIEPAVTANSMMSGHLVQGHIDGVGLVQEVARDDEESRVKIQPPDELLDYIIAKGSIAVDGISLTIADLGKTWFEIALIPTTLKLTALGEIEVGNKVNLETDYIAKTVVHYMRRSHSAP